MINEHTLREMSTWAGFLGIILIISGIISAIGGFFAFIVGAIPGIITVVLGFKLREVKKHADDLLYSDNEESLNTMVASLASFFKIQGILVIIIFVFSLLVLILGGFALFTYTGI